MEYRDAVRARHSAYMLDDRLDLTGLSLDDVVAALRSIAPAVPSSYNVQSARMVVLAGGDHRRLWGIVEDVLRARVADDRAFARTEVKLRNFARAAGTILFYEVDARTEELVERDPRYADMYRTWAEHGNAMMQFAAWTELYDLGLGANIQHYNPVIDGRVREAFGIPEGYRLIAQMVFGRVVSEGEPKTKIPGDEIVTVGHAGDAD